MRNDVHIAMNFMIYVIFPFILLRTVMVKYPSLISPYMATLTMIYFLFLFAFSILTIYMRYTSIPTVFSVVTTIVYMQMVVNQIHMKVGGAYVSVNMGTMLFFIYILLSLKMLVSIYSDTKQKYLSSTPD